MSLSKKTLSRIEEKKIEPIPGWHFWLKNEIIWLLAIFSALLGSAALAVIIHVALNRDWFSYFDGQHPSLGRLLFDLPFFWLFFFFLTLALAYYNVEHSKKGYRYSTYYVLLGSLFVSLFFGAFFNYAGLGVKIDQSLAKNISAYHSMAERATDLWSKPDEGHLGGSLVKVDQKSWQIKDEGNQIWTVDISQAQFECPTNVTLGEKFKISGQETSNNKFQADEIHAWNGIHRLFDSD